MNAAAWPPGGVLHGLGALWHGSGLLNPQDECSPALPQPSRVLSGSACWALPGCGATGRFGVRGTLKAAPLVLSAHPPLSPDGAPLCEQTTLTLHRGHVGGLHFGITDTVMTVCVQVFAWAYIFIPFGFMPRNEMDGLCGNSVFNLLMNRLNVFRSSCTTYIPARASGCSFLCSCHTCRQSV